MAEYVLHLNEEQAKLVAKACEFYMRVRIGQFQEIPYACLDPRMEGDSYCKRRQVAEHYLLEARKAIYPDLEGLGHSYGIGKFPDADKAYDVAQVLNRAMGDPREPFSYYKLPKCETR